MIKRYRKLLSYIGPFKKRRIFILIICAISILVGSFTPYLIGELINYINQGSSISLIFRQGFLALAIAVLDSILNAYQNYHRHLFSVEYMNYFRTLMLKAALAKDISFYKNQKEDYTSRVLQDSINIAQDISIGFPMLILNILRLAIVVVLMLKMNIKLTMIPLLVIPIYIIVFHYINQNLRDKSKSEREEYSHISKSVNEYISGILDIKVNNKENYFLNKFKEKIKTYTDTLKSMKLMTAISYGVSTIITSSLPIIVLLVGGFMVYKGELRIGYLFSFYAYLDFLYEPMNNLIDRYTGINISLGMSDRVLDFLSYDEDLKKGKEITSIDTIEVDNLSFAYSDEEVLKNLTFKLNKGDCLGIVGESGSGKSTLIDILMKNLGGYRGHISINGIDLKDIDKKSFYSNLSIISQDVFIFNDSLANNISYGEKLDKGSEIFKKARLDKFLQSKKSLDAPVSNDSLSGGEKERLALARVLYKNSDLVILDEFTAALDLNNEKAIVDTLINMDKADKIYIIISHRPYPLKMANKILDLNKNKFYQK
ncbi:ABC transporter ATP-binding protein [Anaerococcus sp. AGMB09787]|uniref:ABC transporter ATP-binding protein n=1 Tax=Anaerococcus sp. AGMB09787 TaxID=2922869 RepID=UPI001FAFE499|nr:ABC transporter ATP-binding protein [Anaerococcus sp. AGMB09787]